MSHYVPSLKEVAIKVGVLVGAAFLGSSVPTDAIRTVSIENAADFSGMGEYKKMFCRDAVRTIEMTTADGAKKTEQCPHNFVM